MLVGSKALRRSSSFKPERAEHLDRSLGRPACRRRPPPAAANARTPRLRMPRWRNATAAVSPPMPAPMMTIRSGRRVAPSSLLRRIAKYLRVVPEEPRCPERAGQSACTSTHAGHRLDGAGDLRRDLEAAGQLDLDLGALAQHQHHRDLTVGPLCPASGGPDLRAVETLGDAFNRRLVAQEHAQALLQLCGRRIERLDRLDARAHVVALQLRRQRQQHRRAGLQQIAELRQPFGEQHRFVMRRTDRTAR